MFDEELIDCFSQKFGGDPSCLVSAPGRVNLLGEHTDYNGLPVLPISIPASIRAAVSPRNDAIIHIENLVPGYESSRFKIAPEIPHSAQGHWANYVKAAASALASHTGEKLTGMNALFGSDIPESAGLSSSSALVISSSLALLAVNHIDMDFLKLAELMAEGERYVGTQGGGMDQAICLLGRADHAVKIDFFPLRHSYVPFLTGYSILVVNSLIQAAKTENTLFLYNRRPVECSLAAAVINATYRPTPPITRLGDLRGVSFYEEYSTVDAFIAATFEKESYNLDEIAAITGETAESLTSNYLVNRAGIHLPIPEEGFLLRRRTRHVLTEAERVEQSCETLKTGNAVRFGELMNASHRSCDTDHDISTPELNKLVLLLTGAGAYGARLTGAGFGGCAVALVRDEDIHTISHIVEEEYYNRYITQHHPTLKAALNENNTIMFAVKPSRGAAVHER